VRFMRFFSRARFSRRLVAVCSSFVLIVAGGVTYAFAAGVVHLNTGGWYTCQHDAHANVAHNMIVRNNGGQPMCIGSSNWNDNFTVQRSSVTRNWADFPNIYTGCEMDGTLPQLCTSGYSPIKASTISSDTATVSYYYPQRGFRGNTAYDIWFNKSGAMPKGRDNGTEVMVWLGSNGIGSPVYTRTVKIDGIWWAYDSWRAGSSTGWNYVRYWRLQNWTPHSMATLNLVPFFKDAEHMGKLSSSWYLTGTEYGFEVCYGGRGLQVRNFVDNIVGPRKFLGSLQHKS
jgi:hypothetical protein